MRKSYKREVAVVILAFLGGMGVWGVWKPEALAVAESLQYTLMPFVMLAFGLEGYRQVEETKNAAFRPE